MVRYAGIETALTKWFNWLWVNERVPTQWGEGTIIPLPKSGDLTNPANYRGISLLNVSAKLFGRILANRLSKFLESGHRLSPAQSGFRNGRGCTDSQLALLEALRECRATGITYVVAFIDVKKAFDRVWRPGLWRKLHRMGVRGRMLRMLKQLYDVHRARVRVNGKYSDVFDLQVGTKQGDTLSPLLFTVYIDDLARELDNTGAGLQLPRTQHHFACQLLADDLVLTAPDVPSMQRLMDVCTRWARKWRMEFGIQKCGLLHPRHEDGSLELGPMPLVKLQGQPVEWVADYRYLGLPLRHDLSLAHMVADRVRATREALRKVGPTLRQRDLAFRTKLTIVRAMVTPTALYGCELWCTSEASAKPVQQLVDKAYREVFRAPSRASAEPLRVESGDLPLHLVAVQRRLARLRAWTGPRAAEWPARFIQRVQRGGLGRGNLSWRATTLRMAKVVGWDGIRRTPMPATRARSLRRVLWSHALSRLRHRARARPALAAYVRDAGVG